MIPFSTNTFGTFIITEDDPVVKNRKFLDYQYGEHGRFINKGERAMVNMFIT